MKFSSKIFLKKANFSDIEFLWYLRNQLDVYKYFKNPKKVSWEEHINWIMPIILGISSKTLFIIKKGPILFGQVRFDFNNTEEAIVSIAILKEFRSKGIASESFEKAIKLLKKTKRLKIVLAEVHKENISSQKFFEKLKFKLKKSEGKLLKYEYKII